VAMGGASYTATIDDPLNRVMGAEANANELHAPMPGMVSTVLASAGDTVEAGAPLIVMEAMKMEHTLRAPFDGQVAEVLTSSGAQVESGALLLRMEAP